MYILHYAMVIVPQNFTIPSVSSCFERGLISLRRYYLNNIYLASCHKFSIYSKPKTPARIKSAVSQWFSAS